MAILRFNKTNTTSARGKSGKPSININHNGNVALSTTLVQQLKLEPGHKYYIEIVFGDHTCTCPWYLFLSDEETGFLLRGKKGSQMLQFSCADAVKKILKSLPKNQPANTTPLRASLLISETPEHIDGLELWPILTSLYQPKTK